MAQTDFTIADLLDEARTYVERGWCQCRYGQNARGEMVSASAHDAVSWCATGAIERAVYRHPPGTSYYALWSAATKALDAHLGMFRTGWNDAAGRTQQEVVEAFRNCVAELRGIVPASEWTAIDAYLSEIETVAA